MAELPSADEAIAAMKNGLASASSKAATALKGFTGWISANPRVDTTMRQAQEALEAAQQALAQIGHNIAGVTMVEQANALLESQRRYNDVLATRLAESLDKIKELDERLAKVAASHGRG